LAGLGPILGLALVSGAAALVCEVSWSRRIGLLVGQTTRSGSIVLATFFVGMAIGQAVASRVVGRSRAAIGYGLAELAAGIAALAVPWLLPRFELLGEPLGEPGRFLGCGLAILPASIAYGATWPFLAAWAAQGRPRGATWVYAANTAGAIVGSVAALAVLLLRVGVVGSNLLGAGMSLAVGLLALSIGRLCEPTAIAASTPTQRPRWWYLLAFGSGFGMLAAQVLAGRLFSLVFHNSTYTFGLVVAVFLAALAAGALGAGWSANRWRPEAIAVTGSAAGALVLAASILVFERATGLRYFRSGSTFASYIAGATAMVGLVLGPGVALLGVVLPTCWRGAGGTRIGRLTAVNAFGSAAGVLATEFLLLPGLGLWRSLGLVLGGLAGLGALPLAMAGGRKILIVVAGLAVLPMVMTLLAGSGAGELPVSTSARVIGRWEGAYGVVEVVRQPNGTKLMRLNRHYGLGSTGPASPREFRQGHLPLLLHPRPREVLFLGLGTGVTAASALVHPEVESLTIVELIPEVVEGARSLAAENLGVVDDPRVRLVVDDARHLLRREPARYDVIVSDLFIPWESGTGSLYTVDFYRQVRSRLAPGGRFCQWLPLYQMGEADFLAIADSFASIFPRATLWWGRLSAGQSVVALVGSEGGIDLDSGNLARRIETIGSTLEPGQDEYIGLPSRLARLQIGDWPSGAARPLNTDEHPRVELLAPIHQAGGRLLKGDRLAEFAARRLRALPSRTVQVDGAPIPEPDRRAAARWWDRLIRLGPGRHR
jgi:spermidine synthase